MTIGGSIFLIAVGAILYFATNWNLAHIDIDIVGVILMIAGFAGLILGFVQQYLAMRQGRREVAVGEREVPRDPR